MAARKDRRPSVSYSTRSSLFCVHAENHRQVFILFISHYPISQSTPIGQRARSVCCSRNVDDASGNSFQASGWPTRSWSLFTSLSEPEIQLRAAVSTQIKCTPSSPPYHPEGEIVQSHLYPLSLSDLLSYWPVPQVN